MTPYEQGFRDAIAAAAKLLRKQLAYDSQRAVSWHEVQDYAEAISALSPEDDPGSRAFYRSAQTGVEPALPPPPEHPQHPPGQGAGRATVGASGQPGADFTAAPEAAETCATCGHHAKHHAVDDEERRECELLDGAQVCSCQQFVTGRDSKATR